MSQSNIFYATEGILCFSGLQSIQKWPENELFPDTGAWGRGGHLFIDFDNKRIRYYRRKRANKPYKLVKNSNIIKWALRDLLKNTKMRDKIVGDFINFDGNIISMNINKNMDTSKSNF